MPMRNVRMSRLRLPADAVADPIRSHRPHSRDAPSALPCRPAICTSSRQLRQPASLKANHAVSAQKIVRRQPAGKAGRAAGRQHVRRPGRVVAHRHRAVVAQKDRAARVDIFGSNARRSLGGNVQMLRRDLVRPARPLRPHRAPESSAPNCSKLCRARSPRPELRQLAAPARPPSLRAAPRSR